MPIVQMPDGTLVEMPDNPDPALLAELQRLAPKPMGQVERKARIAGASAVRGAVGLPVLAGDVLSGTPDVDPMISPLGAASNSLGAGEATYGQPRKATMAGSTALRQLGPKPETTGEKYLSSAVEGAVGGLISVPKMALQSVITGLGAGLGSELGAQISGDEDAFLPRILGGLAGGGVTSLAASRFGPNPRIQELAREALDGVDQSKLAEAKTFMQAAGREGVDLDAAQALEGVGASPSGLKVLRDTLANVKEGDATQRLLRAQPGALQERGATWLGGVPGNVYSPEQAANNLSETATAAINAAKANRSNQVRELYNRAGMLPDGTTQELYGVLDDFIKQPGVTSTTKAAVKELQKQLVETPQKANVAQLRQRLAAATLPSAKADLRAQIEEAANASNDLVFKQMHAKDADTLISEFVGAYKGTPISPANPVVRGETKTLGKRMNAVLQANSPEIKAAEQRFAQISRDVVDPLKQGQVGGLAGKAGYRADTQASVAKMQALFSAGRDPNTRNSPILQTARTLNKQDPDAFRDAAKTYYSGIISNAFDAGIGTAQRPMNKDAAERIYKGLFANQPQYLAMKDTVTAMAESANVPPAAALRGLDNFAKIVKATRLQPDQIGGMTRQQIIEMAEKHHGANFIRIFGFLPFERMARNMENATMSKTLRELDRLITTPEGLQILAELSKYPVMSRQAAALAATAGGALATLGERTDQITPE
jgi:hypothetical protein